MSQVEDIAIKNKKKIRKVDFESDLGTVRDLGFQESDSETKLYGINSLNLVESG